MKYVKKYIKEAENYDNDMRFFYEVCRQPSWFRDRRIGNVYGFLAINSF
ncbi:hypothetical protein AGMMS49532_10650 [Endomicrobiia bacterium]|nr:hypothetical protein AGMMS49532_10650 [Endomicrobiia bacterium]